MYIRAVGTLQIGIRAKVYRSSGYILKRGIGKRVSKRPTDCAKTRIEAEQV